MLPLLGIAGLVIAIAIIARRRAAARKRRDAIERRLAAITRN